MKELTVEEKAKRYDEAIELAKEINDEQRAQPFNVMIRVFPEIKESDDEMIRKKLLSSFKCIMADADEDELWYGVPYNDIITWLEKQGNKSIDGTFVDIDSVREDFMQEVYRVLDGDSDNDRVNQIIRAFDSLPTIELGKQCEQIDGSNKEYWRGYREGKQEVLDKYAELEKKGEKKLAESIQEAKYNGGIVYEGFNEGDGCYKVNLFHLSKLQVELIENLIASWKNFTNNTAECGEERIACKVEPKFHEGDWVLNNVCFPVQIASIEDGMYVFTEGDALSASFVDKNYHLWTIQDAEDGDVLVNGNEIVIFKENNFNQKDLSGCMFVHCSLLNNKGYWYTIGGINPSNYVPATKEQRDTLMKAMTDAGYTFDFEKKELMIVIKC